MPKIKVKSLKNRAVDEIDLNENVFGSEVKQHLLHEVVRMQRCRARAGTACAKERNAVSGGGKKPYRQKGTGRARQGSERAPNHVGGGIIFGPKPRSYDFSVPKKVRRRAMCSALSLYASENRLIVVSDFDLEEAKTKALTKVLDGFKAKGALLVDFSENDKLRLSARNLKNHHFIPAEGLNVYDILKHDEIIISKRALLDVQERLLKPVRAGRDN